MPTDVPRRAPLTEADPEVAQILKDEERRQQDNLELIASENVASAAVRQAMSSALTDKYAEGYPGKRYYGGCEFADQVERLAIERVTELFGCNFANVQPHSGAQANMAVYFALMEPGDTLMAMNLSHGGHLTHGSPVNFSGKLYNVVAYGVDEKSETIDYDEMERIAVESKPKVIVSGATAYSRHFDFERIGEIAREVDAKHVCDMAHYSGLVAGGVYPSPIPHADVVTSTTHKSIRGPRGGIILWNDDDLTKDINRAVFPNVQGGPLMHIIAAKAVAFGEALRPEFKQYAERIVENARALASALDERGLRIVSGGTDSHVMLVDVRGAGITGKVAQEALERANITTNRNTIPFDPESPFVTSGIRLGTPAVTSRGMGPDEMRQIAEWIDAVLRSPDDLDKAKQVKGSVRELCARFPIHDV